MSLRTELESLKKENDSLYNLYQKYKLLDLTMVNVKEIKNDFHNIMNRQFRKNEFLRDYRDLLGRFFHKLAKKLNNQWKEVKKAISNYHYEDLNIDDISKRACIFRLNEILRNTKMDFKDITLLFELKGDGNDTFYQNWQKFEKIKKNLKDQQFPSGTEKYKDSLEKLINDSNIWISWK
ncbi:hypothetical protein RhiirC2_781596 [Rhizophagus irregularis]|uniref:Uncharacterized protein n=1 Tax=Rhizophagus irregularis TaxID=588596 RepID=A0A2N1N4Y7_9GLOM|nr:hypothetical protein RhiirC2_781596 [Rhizophagus irregularis]